MLNLFKNAFIEMQTIIEAAICGLNTDVFIHISHNDLDGHGCHAIRAISFDKYYGNFTKRKGFRTKALAIGDVNRIYDVIDDMLKQEIGYFAKSITVLITDIGGIDIEVLQTRYKGIVEGSIRFVVVDHHRSKYQDECIYVNNNYRLYRNESADTLLVHNDGIFPTYMLITNDTKSATLALASLLYDGFARRHGKQAADRYIEIANEISMYDTGNIGNWYVDPDESPANIDYRIKLNKLVPEINKGNKFILTNTVRDYVFNAAPFSHDELVVKSIIEDSRNYDRMVRKLTIVDCSDSALLIIDGAKMKIPENSNIKKIAVIGKCKGVRLTLFASKYLPEHPEIDAIVYVNVKNGIVDTRSYKDNINMFEICHANGGGGHFHAAGYPIW